ncbi:two-component regulator propeller domain-containing protein [Sediminitomix flava]|uniref:Ligand-binding sensor domain-containing protein n=1 Tax=Sediminitomix flava TaxID=379075 RepID=A0A315ZFA9_SEDFL|nr:two-component regulator propeller domain-containing protein [Sediminitomix flava]PWJ44276.1 ligand-binding sensor domain-containing protein [Sediminitomix flava]
MKALFYHSLLTLLLLASNAYGQQGTVKFEHITSEDGLSSMSVYTISQDKYGFTWFGTEKGLNRFDGYTIKTFYHDAEDSLRSISGNDISCLYTDKDGDFWVGTFGRGINLYDPSTESFREVDGKVDSLALDDRHISGFLEDSHGNFWVTTYFGGIHLFDKEAETLIGFDSKEEGTGTNSSDIRGVVEDEEGNIWFASFNNGVSVYNPNTKSFSYIKHQKDDPYSLSTNALNCIYKDKKGTIWIGTNEGGFCKYLGDGKFKTFTYDEKNSNSLGQDQVLAIAEDRLGSLWLATFGGGVNYFDVEKETFKRYYNNVSDPSSLSANNQFSIYVDSNDLLWVGTYGGGVSVFDPHRYKFKTYTKTDKSLNAKKVDAVLLSGNNLYTGTYGGGVSIINQETGGVYSYTDHTDISITQNQVGAILKDTKGRLWIGTDRGGVNVWNEEDGKFDNYQPIDGDDTSLGDRTVASIAEDIYGNIWLASLAKGVSVFNEDTKLFKTLKMDNKGLLFDGIRSLYTDDNGLVWLGMQSNGIQVIDAKSLKVIKTFAGPEIPEATVRDPLYKTHFCDFYKDNDGILWAGTNTNGLLRYNIEKEVFEQVENDELKSVSIRSLNGDRQGNIWIGTSKGLYKYNTSIGEVVKRYDKSDGLPSDEFTYQGSSRGEDGQLAFGTIDGVILFYPDELIENKKVPPVYFMDFSIFNKSIKFGDETEILAQEITFTDTIRVDYEQSVISFDFLALNYSIPEKNKYEYQLKGFSDQWFDSETRSATFTNLNPGEYTLTVRASNNDGLWNEEGKQITLFVTPPYWMTWWFRTIVLLSFLGSGYGWYRHRLNKEIVQKHKLEEQVVERTAELVQKNEEVQQQAEELALQRDFLAEKNEQITQSIRYAETIQQAFLPSTGVMDDMLKAYFLVYKAKDLVSGDFYWAYQKDQYSFMVVADCTGHGVPGAFMSMIGTSLLNHIIKEKGVYDPAVILAELKIRLKVVLKQESGSNSDGMDVALCRFEYEEDRMNVVYAGSKSTLYYYTEHNLKKVKGDNIRIGGIWKRRNQSIFTNKTFTLNKGDVLFMSSDGLIDQNDGTKNRFGSKRLEELFMNCVALKDFSEGEALVNQTINGFQKDANQRDDITIFGMKV